MKKILNFFKYTSIALGLPVVLYFCYVIFYSLFLSGGEDMSTKDADFKFTLKETSKPEQLPNILLINADDLGYGDVGCYGSTAVRTPNIDSLAASGMRFTNHYTSGAVCSPSRVGLMTGRYPIRAGITSIVTPDDWKFSLKVANRLTKLFNNIGASDHGRDSYVNGLPHKEITIAEALKQRGYATGIAGKWHLGDMVHKPGLSPLRHGFDDWLGINSANDERPVVLQDGDKTLRDNILDNQEDFSQLFAERAISFIEKNKTKAFFYYLAFTAPHQPLLPSKNFKGKSKGGAFGDVVEEMDFYIGKVLNSLKANGLDENTIVIFTSDNGPWYQGSSGGLRGGKGQPFEGAFKVPFIVSWKNHIKANSTASARVMNIDVFPTLLSLAGLANPSDREIDGKNITEILLSKNDNSPHEKLFFYHYDKAEGVIMGYWKYYGNSNTYVWPTPVNKKGTLTETFGRAIMGDLDQILFDLKTDPNEDYDVSKHNSKKVTEMQKVLDEWNKKVKYE